MNGETMIRLGAYQLRMSKSGPFICPTCHEDITEDVVRATLSAYAFHEKEHEAGK